jgi:hypothetical protein
MYDLMKVRFLETSNKRRAFLRNLEVPNMIVEYVAQSAKFSYKAVPISDKIRLCFHLEARNN